MNLYEYRRQPRNKNALASQIMVKSVFAGILDFLTRIIAVGMQWIFVWLKPPGGATLLIFSTITSKKKITSFQMEMNQICEPVFNIPLITRKWFGLDLGLNENLTGDTSAHISAVFASRVYDGIFCFDIILMVF